MRLIVLIGGANIMHHKKAGWLIEDFYVDHQFYKINFLLGGLLNGR